MTLPDVGPPDGNALGAAAPQMIRPDVDTDVVVVGAGAAGASAALAAAAGGRRVTVLVKDRLGDGCTSWAQGGLAAVLDPTDSFAEHARDTLVAGAGLCDLEAVRLLVAAAPAAVESLQRLGAVFDPAAGHPAGTAPAGVAPAEVSPVATPARLALTREGGHGRDRVVHAGGDATGAEVSRALMLALTSTPRIVVQERTVALDPLLDERGTVVGLRVARVADDGALVDRRTIRARAVVLASGGFGQAYATTTNPEGATGDGIVLALRAGAAVADLEFMQFHPTVLWQGPGARGQQVLVSEAVRGAGAVLVDATGQPIMPGLHPLADLAPRDVVSAALQAHLARAPHGRQDHVWLDATALGRVSLHQGFPGLVLACQAIGLDPVTEPVPVLPGAHYACGGVRADMSGRTSVRGLFAVGEVACTGVQGANRLASNSLTEGLVVGRLAGELLARELPTGGSTPLPPTRNWPQVDPRTRSTTAEAMTRHAGVLRSGRGLAALTDLLAEVPRLDRPLGPTSLASLEASALHLLSTLIAVAAAAREESRGCHRRSDFPATSARWARRQEVRLVDDRLEITPHATERAA